MEICKNCDRQIQAKDHAIKEGDNYEHGTCPDRLSPLSKDQEIKIMKDGKVYIKASVSDTAQLRWWLLGFGGQVEVISPKSLREELFKSAKDMIKVYR